METWKGGDAGAPSLRAPVPVSGRTCWLLLWGWGWVGVGLEGAVGRRGRSLGMSDFP